MGSPPSTATWPRAADRPYFSGKHKKHGTNVQMIADPFGRLLWASPALPGAVHDLKAARTHGVIEALTDVGLCCWADKGYQGAGGTVPDHLRPSPGTSLTKGLQGIKVSLPVLKLVGVVCASRMRLVTNSP